MSEYEIEQMEFKILLEQNNNKKKYIKDNTKMSDHIIVIDSEGVYVNHDNRFKIKRNIEKFGKDTIWIKSVAAIKYFYLEDRSEEKYMLFNLPKYETLDEKTKTEWQKTIGVHHLDWDAKGHIHCYAGVDDIIYFCENAKMIYAKGTKFENRLLNNFGLFGQTVTEGKINKDLLRFSNIVDLTYYGVRTFDSVHKGAVHNPLVECKFFLKELINKKVLEKTLPKEDKEKYLDMLQDNY